MIELNERQLKIAEKYKSQALPGSAPKTTGALQLNERQLALAKKYAPAAQPQTKTPTVTAPRVTVQAPKVTAPSVPTPSYASEMSRLEEVRRRAAVDLDTAAVADAESKMKTLRASVGKQTVGDRVSDAVSGSFNDLSSAVVNTLGVANNAYHDPDFNRRQIATYTKVLEDGRTTDGKPLTMAMRLKIADRIVEMREEIRQWESEDSATNKLYKAADTMKETGGKQVEAAKEGLGKVGQFTVDVGVGAAQLAGDLGANLLVPGAGLAMMGVRGFGGASQEARQNGATLGEQVAYGAGTAAAGILTEKLANIAGPFKKAFGGGVLDKALSKITAKPAGKLVLSALSEGSEEALESVMQPVLQKLTYNPEAQYDEEWLAETLYSAAVGAALGGLGGSVDVIGSGDTKAVQSPEGPTRVGESGVKPLAAPGLENAKAAPGEGTAGKYTENLPQNVERPTVPIIAMKRDQYVDQAGNVPKVGNRLRADAIARARNRLRLDQNEAAYVPASNVLRNGEEYVLKITKSSLNKMLSPADGETIPLESILVMDNLERIANNGVWKKSEGDRKARQQIKGFDHLQTTAYIDNEPYSVEMRVKLVQEAPGKNVDNVLYYYTPEEIVSIEKVDTSSPTVKRRAPHISFGESVSTKERVSQAEPIVNVEDGPRPLTAPGKDAQQAYGRSFEQLAGDVRHLKTVEEMLAEQELGEAERTVLNRIGEQYRTGRINQEEYDAAVESIVKGTDGTDGNTVDALPTKAKDYLERSEKKLIARMANALSVPRSVQRDFLKGYAREMSEEYLRTGTVSQETTDRLFEEAYAAGIESETAFYDQYKDVKNKLRTTAVTISEADSADIADYGAFRKSAWGTLRIVNEGGLGVDVAYQELQGMAPELFPDSIVHPADQLMRMYEVGQSIRKTERTLDEYHGDNAEEFKKWAKNDFEAALGDSMAELRNVKRYADEKTAQRAAEMAASADAVRSAYKDIRNARRTADKAVGRNLLTDYDKVQVGRLLKGEITLEDLDPEKVNIRGVKEVYEAKQEYEKLSKVIREYNTERKAKLREEADADLATANEWDDKPAGILYSRETMERNIRDIVPERETAERIIGKYFKPVHVAQAESTKTKNAYRDRVKALNLSRKKASGNEVSEAYAVQLVGEAQDNIRVLLESNGRMKSRDGKTMKDWEAVLTDLWAKNPNLDRGKIEKAVAEFHSIYDELFQKMNEVRIRNGYEPIAYRQGYFPHFQADGGGDGVLGAFGKALGIETDVTALPTSINGLTHTFRPGITWFGAAQERKGFETTYDAVQGFDKYIEGAADVIHQTDNIQRLRALASQMRYRTTDDGIRKQVDAILENDSISEEDKQNRIDKIYENGRFALSNFVVELEEYTNLLANKKSRADRNMEQALGRRMYNIVKGLESRVAANMVAVNPASWLTNFIPITQGAATVDTGRLIRAMGDTLKAYKDDDGMVGRSSFLTNRRGSDPLVRTWAQGASATLSKPMEYIDQFTADTLVRARYSQNRDRGLSEAEAMSEADSWAATVMADRSKGSMPTLFNRSNPITKVFTQFQLEVNNQLSYLFKDVPDELKEKGLAALGAGLLKFFVGAFLYNEVYEYVIGRRPALDPIGILNDTVGDLSGYELPNLVSAGVDAAAGKSVSLETEKTGTYEAVENLAKATAEELPFVGGLLGGGRVPISSALPDVANLGKAVFSDTWDPKKKRATIVKELAAPATYLAMPFGGGQIKKIFQGIQAVRKGGSYSVDSSGRETMQYPVFNDTAAEKAEALTRSVLFGKSSLPTAQEWVEDGFDSYGAKQTAVYQGMNDAGVSDREAYALLEELRAVKKTDTESVETIQRRVLRESDISPEGKTVAYYGLLASEKDIEVMDKLADTSADMGVVTDVLMAMRDANLMTGEKGKRTKYAALLDADLDGSAKLEIYRAAISDEKDDEIKSVMDAGLTLDDWMRFESDTAGLKSDDSSTKKEKVVGVIDGMDIVAEQKDAMFMAAGYAKSGLEDAPWNVVESKKYQLAAPGKKDLKLETPKLKALELPKL